MSTPYLFDNRVLDRHTKIANGQPVESEIEFAEALVLLAKFPDAGVSGDSELLDSFIDRKRMYARSERGGVGFGVLLIVVLLGAGGWGWFHGSSAPNGATLLAVLFLAVAIAVPTLVIGWARRVDREAAAYTRQKEAGMQQDTTGDHIWDA